MKCGTNNNQLARRVAGVEISIFISFEIFAILFKYYALDFFIELQNFQFLTKNILF